MKITAALVILFIFSSCAHQKEIIPQTQPAAEIQHQPQKKQEPVLPAKKYKTFLKCEEDTKSSFNSSGIDVLPFARPVFFDIDKDGKQELIVGSKDGFLRLYRNTDLNNGTKWRLEEKYFEGIKAGAFSSPAVGDIDNDGKTEIILGTGGFSSDSGKVVFYRNSGTSINPLWTKINKPEIKVGNDATPVLFDINNDGKPDLIIGNSSGNLFLYRNQSKKNRISFVKDYGFLKGIELGMYVVPAVTAVGNRIVLIAGNGMGNLYMIERSNGRNSSWVKTILNISFSSFAAPAFVENGNPDRKDIVISDGNGMFYYFKNLNNNYKEWKESHDLFSERILPGPSCAPSIVEINGRSFMVVGNINGELKLYVHNPSSNSLSWTERPDFFNNIKLSGFSRGVITEWQGKNLLITGQQDGILKAFLNAGSLEKPLWIEQEQFFRGLPKILHASPSVFDIDGDGIWELIVGDVDGHIRGFRYKVLENGMPVWEKINSCFEHVKVDRYATPALFKDLNNLNLLVGQQDGRIITFTAEIGRSDFPVFYKEGFLQDIHVNDHSSPTVHENNGIIEMSVGDYNGNLRHFACKRDMREIKEN